MPSVHVDLKPDFKMKSLKVGAGVCGKVARGDIICSGHLLPALQNSLWTLKGTNDIPSYGDLRPHGSCPGCFRVSLSFSGWVEDLSLASIVRWVLWLTLVVSLTRLGRGILR